MQNYIVINGNKIPFTEEQIREITKTLKLDKPKWQDFGEVEGYYINSICEVIDYELCESRNTNKNVFPTEEEAEACLALSQLCQWRDKYNEGWKPNWKDNNSKFCTRIESDEIVKDTHINYNKILYFKSKEIRDKFFDDFYDLIVKAIPLL